NFGRGPQVWAVVVCVYAILDSVIRSYSRSHSRKCRHINAAATRGARCGQTVTLAQTRDRECGSHEFSRTSCHRPDKGPTRQSGIIHAKKRHRSYMPCILDPECLEA